MLSEALEHQPATTHVVNRFRVHTNTNDLKLSQLFFYTEHALIIEFGHQVIYKVYFRAYWTIIIMR